LESAGADLKGPVSAGAGEEALEAFYAALDDDFNTPDALAVVQSVARQLNAAKAAGDASRAGALAGLVRKMGGVLGLLQQDPETYLKRGKPVSSEGESDGASLSDAEIEAFIEARRAARAAKNFRESDRIRDQLAAAGIVLEDKPGGVSAWRRA
jgi:cysteinyl-tRNA synthetase